MYASAKVALAMLVIALLAACGRDAPPAPPDQHPPQQPPNPVDPVAIVDALPADASAEQLHEALNTLLPAIYRTPSGDFSPVFDALGRLRDQPRVVEALMQRYESLPTTEYQQRIFTIQVLGELRRPDAAAALRAITWSPLPPKASTGELLSPRDFEEMIRVQAVRGIAYLRTEAADREVTAVMLKHESKTVQVAAIDAYLWNHEGDPEAADRLRKILPRELHPFVDAVRVHGGMDPQSFNEQISTWRKKWGTTEVTR